MKHSTFYLMMITLVAGIVGLTASACRDGAREDVSTNAVSAGPTSAPPANPPPPAKSLPKIVAFGDSLTAGYGLPPAQSYPSLLQERLQKDGYQYEVVNAGVSGDTSAGGVRRIDWSLEGDVRVVILELGANDMLRGLPVKEMKENLRRIIERAQAKGAIVVLAGMYAPPNSGPEYVKEFREAYEGLAREYNLALIPFFLDRVAGIETLNQADGAHPNAEGTKIVAETVYQTLRPVLDKK
ncbi:MAG TPA: arylesterase [Pyrinomonadaceae bacterium]|jgi:acyl-CoA thioesterase-1|nr:arylesterase [Pyrinomonadaceae bacterium]